MNEKPHILIVDDERSVLTALKMAFEHKQWRVDVVDDAMVALQHLRKTAYDILLVDKNLPGMDGIELIQQVRLDGIQIGVVMITGYASLESAIDTANLAVDAYIEKPFDNVFKLVDAVEEVIEKRRRPRRTSIRVAELVARSRSQPPPEGWHPLFELDGRVADREVLRPRVAAFAVASESEALSAALSSAGVDLLAASSLDEVFWVVERQAPDAVILVDADDIIGVLARVRSIAPRVPVLIASRRLDLAMVKTMIWLGITVIVRAGVASEDFRTCLQQLLQGLAAPGSSPGSTLKG